MDQRDKMRLAHRTVQYEGIPAPSAIGMALFESSGMRKLIDERCNFDPARRILSPGMVVKALIGPAFNIRNKYPLYLVNKFYSSAPTDRLFGPYVQKDDLYDNALGRGLDSLFGADLAGLFKDCSDLICTKFGFRSYVFHADGTDISFYGVEPEDTGDGAAVPRHNGHPKDLRTELLQYELQIMTDSNRIIRYMKPYSGNVGDPIMDGETLDFIGTHFSEEERARITVVADCKLVTTGNLKRMEDLGLGFVSKCPETFVDHGHRHAVEAANSGLMHPCSKDPGLRMSDFDLDIDYGGESHRLRFVAFRREDEVRRRIEGIRADTKAVRKMGYVFLEKRKYRTEYDAIQDFKRIREDPDNPYRAKYRAVRRKEEIRLVGGDSHKKDWNPPKQYREWWELEIDYVFSEEKARAIAERESTVVLVTNLPRSCSDRGSYREGVTDERVLDIYNQEYKVEQSFRLMKSGIGMNSIYLQTPSRENAMMFVICIAVLLSNIADAIFRRAEARLDGRQLTMYHLAHETQTWIVAYSRSENVLNVMGQDDAGTGSSNSRICCRSIPSSFWATWATESPCEARGIHSRGYAEAVLRRSGIEVKTPTIHT